MLPGLQSHPRADLDLQITQLHALPTLGKALGVSLFTKRDDTASLAMGGNKVRQLEFYFGQAKAQGADTVLITGAVQSNYVRLCAAAAAKLGLRAVVQLEQRVPNDDPIYNNSGNVLLNRLLGAEIHYFFHAEDEAAADASLDKLAAECRAKGWKPYVIHLGIDHPPLGGLGYAVCAAECFLQCQRMGIMPDHVVISSGSGLTHAGFLAGARGFGWSVPVHGICVRRDATQQHARITRRVGELLELMTLHYDIKADDVLVHDTVFAPGYGKINDAVMSAITRSAQLEGLLLDPVYTGRGMAGLIALVEEGIIKQEESVLFIHTGGLPAVFAYQQDLQNRLVS